MKKILKWLFVTMIITANAYAQKNAAVIQPVFSGIVKLPGNVGSGNDTLSVVYREPYQPYGTVEHEFKVISDKDGRFKFTLPPFDAPLEMRIYMKYTDSAGMRSRKVGSMFLSEKDDVIKVDIIKTGWHKSDRVTFSGKGVEKYNLANSLEKIISQDLGYGEFPDGFNDLFAYNLNAEKTRMVLDTTNLERNIARYCELTEKMLNKKASLINNSGLSPQMKKMIAYNCAPVFDVWTSAMASFYLKVEVKNAPHLRAAVKKQYDKNKDRFKYIFDPLMQFCPRYLINLASNEYYDLIMHAPASKIAYQDLYQVFITRYAGPVRESLLGNLFGFGIGWKGRDPLSPETVDSLRKDSEKYITIPVIKELYDTQMKLAIGAKIFNGRFKDLDGKEVSLDAFRGKVVFIDFWFTGCGACTQFHQNFHKKGYPLLKDNKDFVYVSVSMDKEKEKWLKGISGGAYSSTDYVNLNSAQGSNHPFLKYYKRATFPFILLLDREGRIYANQIIPQPAAVVELIKKALAK